MHQPAPSLENLVYVVKEISHGMIQYSHIKSNLALLS